MVGVGATVLGEGNLREGGEIEGKGLEGGSGWVGSGRWCGLRVLPTRGGGGCVGVGCGDRCQVDGIGTVVIKMQNGKVRMLD